MAKTRKIDESTTDLWELTVDGETQEPVPLGVVGSRATEALDSGAKRVEIRPVRVRTVRSLVLDDSLEEDPTTGESGDAVQ